MVKDFIVEKILNCLFDKNYSELKQQVLSKLELNRLLKKAINQFTESNYFETEFKDYSIIINNKVLQQISNEKLDPSLTLEKLMKLNFSTISKLLVSDDRTNDELIVQNIFSIYKDKSSFKISLSQILEQQQSSFADILKKISEQNAMLQKIDDNTSKIKNKSINALLRDKLIDICIRYLHFVMKNPVSIDCNGNLNNLTCYLKEVKHAIDKIDCYITKDFCAKDIVCFEATKETVENFFSGKDYYTNIKYDIFCEDYFKIPIKNHIENIRKYNDFIPKNIMNELFNLEILMSSNILTTDLRLGITFDFSKARVDIVSLKETLIDIGNCIILIGNMIE